jgi:hypothetical protein
MFKILLSIIIIGGFTITSQADAQMYVSQRDAMKYQTPTKSPKLNKTRTSILYQTTPSHQASPNKKHSHKPPLKHRHVKV